MARNKAFERLYGFYLYMHHHRIPLQEMADFEKEEWEKMGKDLEILEEIRNYFKVIDYGEEYQNRYALQVGYPYPAGTIIPINKELYLKWSRWLEK